MELKKIVKNSNDNYNYSDQNKKTTKIEINDKEEFRYIKKGEILQSNEIQEEKDEFGITLYDNEIKYSDDIQTIVKKVINGKNIDFYKKYSSYLLYLSNEMENNEIDENKANDDNTKTFFKIKLNPQNMCIIYNVVDKRTIEKILSLCNNKYKKSKTSIGYITDKQENYKITNSLNRTSSTVFLYTIRSRSIIEENQIECDSSIVYTKDESIIELENTICNLVKIPLCYLEPLAIVKYEENNYFNLHHDGSFRRATLLIYLNDVNKDGETVFPYYNLSIKPIQGSAIFWYNNIPLEDEYAITYCINRIKKIDEKEKLICEQNSEGKDNTYSINDKQNIKISCFSKTEKSSLHLHNATEDNFIAKNLSVTDSNENKNYIKNTVDLINFLNEKSNLQKYSIDLVKDELGNTYISDMTMIHQANKVTKECKYVINCFFNINIVRNV
ncbi:prolyl 4-hydroxylase subunit alpha, putative [Plasmodium gallinaceum]|uniref:Prolyl 4-hydroxylase subunit alpha, putative n=1 Tax=Plasmodium gallinaceum TaxID=5849 RepID=A0A1J1GM53_PLAGA|nr:prolyl 4-hydroxylase subunit alpha, putative [Plasmodium gallinaceum]CRG93520.1 prolyl 4-hydroxylase subunit alpha, putative [Plasmodium gallinaceum]